MNDYPFFRVGGEMGKLVRAFDWTNSPLGSPHTWPQSLRTTVSTVLGSKFPMLLMWGDDLIQIYNDGYREILGDIGKHPTAMGQNAAECWAEVWSLISPSIDRLRSGQEGTWNEDSPSMIQRNGRVEEIFTTSSLGPVTGDSGSVEGVLLVCMDTTNRVHASEESRRNIQRFEAAVKAVQGIVWTNNSVGEMEGKQPGWEELTGQKQADYQGFGWTRAVHPDDVQRSVDAWNMAVNTGGTYEIEHRILRKTGDWGIFSARATPLLNQDGSIREWVGVHTDITAQRNMEISIIQNEQKLRSFLESTPIPTAVYAGKHLQIEMANQAIIDLWGKGSDVVGKTFTDLLPELKTQQVFDQINTVYATGVPFHKRNTAINVVKGGRTQTGYYNYSFTPVLTPGGEVYGVMNTAADVTDLNIARQNLAASEKRLSNLVMQANVATALFAGKEMILIMANAAMKQLWEIDETSRSQSLLDLQPDLKQQLFPRDIGDILFKGEKYSLEAVPIKKGDRETVYIDFNYQPLRDDAGSVTDILVMGVDVTSQLLAHKRIEEVVTMRTEELADANRKLVQSNDELSQYAYVASHDLQEPLRKIRTYTSMLFRGIDIDVESRELINKIAGSAERMSSLIQDLLNFSSLVYERETLEEVNLQIIVSNIVKDYELSVQEKRASISIGELPNIVGSALQMNQLFYNLLGNALKFTSGERLPIIEISSRSLCANETSQYVTNPEPGIEYHEIAVSDNGIGFAPEYRMQIFEPFKRLHTRNAFPGSGIGLALCQRIVSLHGGALHAKSAAGSGSTFFVVLPNSSSGRSTTAAVYNDRKPVL